MKIAAWRQMIAATKNREREYPLHLQENVTIPSQSCRPGSCIRLPNRQGRIRNCYMLEQAPRSPRGISFKTLF